jgi:hypothetical protein
MISEQVECDKARWRFQRYRTGYCWFLQPRLELCAACGRPLDAGKPARRRLTQLRHLRMTATPFMEGGVIIHACRSLDPSHPLMSVLTLNVTA